MVTVCIPYGAPSVSEKGGLPVAWVVLLLVLVTPVGNQTPEHQHNCADDESVGEASCNKCWQGPETVNGGGKLGQRGVAVQDKCPAKCSA